MPVSIRTLPTTTGNSYLSSSGYSSRYSSSSAPSSYTSTRFSYRPSGTGYTSTSSSSYHRSTGDDTTSGTTGTNRFGVSRYTKSSLLDRDSASKPPTGSSSSSATLSRHRTSDSRARDLSVDNYLKNSYSSGYHSSSPSSTSTSASTKLSDSSYQNTKRQSYSSLARSVATSGADLYEQYSPSNYIPKVELSRSRSLSETSGGKLLDTTNNHINHHLHSSSVGLGSRASSRDRETSIDRTAGITSKVNKSSTSAATNKTVSCDRHHNNNHNRHNNNNLSCGSVAVINTKTNQKPATNRVVATTSSLANRNNNVQPIVGIVLGTACATKTATASSPVNNSTSASCIKRNTTSTGATLSLANRRSDKSGSATNINVPTMITSHQRGNSTAPPVSASDFYKLTGVNPLSVETNFLESECKLARSQVSSIRESPNRLSYVGRNNNANKPLIYQSRSASANRSITEDNINNNSGRTMNCLQKSPELLDDIKYIDSDDSERKHSPPISSKMASAKDYMKGLSNGNSGTANGTTTLPATISKKSVIDVTSNKYNTITSSSKSCHQQHHLHNHVTSSRHRNGSIPGSNSLSSSEPRNTLVNGVERLDKDVPSVSPPPHISNGAGTTAHNHSAAASTTSTPIKCVDKLLEKSKLTSDLNGGSVSYPFA